MKAWNKVVDKLSTEELEHLKDSGVVNMKTLHDNFKWQAYVRTKHPMEPCHECKAIARKLGML